MGVRVYGVDQAPGTRLEEVTSFRPPQPGQVGTGYIVGAFRRGPVGGPSVPPVKVATIDDLIRRRGVRVSGHYAEQACRDFLDMAAGAGQLYTERVCDGSEVAATGSLYSRRVPRGVLFRADDTLTPLALSWAVSWPGRDGGKRKTYGGQFALFADVTATTVATGKAMLLNELAGGTLTLRGVSTKTYTILSNTTAGVITVDADENMAADLAADTPANLNWFAEVVNLETDEEKGAVRRAVAVRVIPRGQRRPNQEFGLSVRLDGVEVKSAPDLSMVAAAGRSEAAAFLNAASDNYEVDLTNEWSGGDAADARPANWAGIIAEGGLGTNQLTLHVVEWQHTNGDATGYVHLWQYGTDLRADTLTLTFTGAGAFTVESTLVDDLPNGAVGVAYTGHTTHPQLVGFTVVAGAIPFQAGDIITIRVKALPTDGSLKGAYLHPDADGANAATRIPIQSNTSRTVTVGAAYDLTDFASEPDHAEIDTTSAGPWNTLAASWGGPVTLTGITVDGAAVAAYTFPDTINLTAAALKVSWEAHDPRLFATINADGTVSLGSRSTGALAQFGYTGGTAIGILMPAADSVNGTDGSLVVIEYNQEGQGGYDGVDALASSDIVSALDVTGSIAQILSLNIGQPVIAAPGWANDNVTSAGQDLAEAVLGIYLPEYPVSVLTEEAAVAKLDDWGLNDFYAPVWPSWGYIASRDGSGSEELYSRLGKVMGLQARSWASNGMGKAPAGVTTQLRGDLRPLKSNDDVEPDPEKLNKSGIRTIMRRGGTSSPVIWGDRLPGSTGVWLHKRALKNQIGRELLYPVNFDQFVFERNTSKAWGRIHVAVRALMRPHYDEGWFNDDLPFDSAVLIKVDVETTPAAVQAAGKAVVAIGIVPPETIEQIVFRLSEAGVEV